MAGHFANEERPESAWESFKRGLSPKATVAAVVIAVTAVAIALVVSSLNPGGDRKTDDAKTAVQQVSTTKQNSVDQTDTTAVQEPVEPKPVDKTYLRSAVELAWGIDESNYSPESYAAMRAMINDGGVAATVLNDENATQEQVDDALDSLYAAINGLAEVLNPANYASVAYSDVARTPDAYAGQKLVFSGRVLQVVESSGETDLRIATDGEWDDVVMAGFDPSIIDYRILEDDYVTVYGTCVGIYTYTATMGQQISIPGIYCDYVVLQ